MSSSNRTSKAQRDAIHLESAPRKFASTGDYSKRDAQRKTFDLMARHAEKLTPADAVRFAQMLLVHVDANGIDYGDFQSAQATQRYVRKAINALCGLAL